MFTVIGILMLFGGAWVCTQNTQAKFAPSIMVAGGVMLIWKAFS
jgi:hypothetical protein